MRRAGLSWSWSSEEVFEPLGMRYAMMDIPGNPAREELSEAPCGPVCLRFEGR